MFWKVPLLIILLYCLSGCSKPRILEEQKFIEVYTDLVIAQDTSQVPGNDFTVVKAEIFKKHGVTDKEYKATLDYYNEDPKRWDEFFKKTLDRLETLKKASEKKP